MLYGVNGISGANGVIEPFGCYGSISYPLSGKAEEWLADVARDALAKGGIYPTMLNFIIDNKVSGHEINKLRGHRGMFLELNEPLEVIMSKGLTGKKAVNTGQILFMFFGSPVVEPAQMVLLLYLANALKFYDEQPGDTVCQMTILVKAGNLPEKWWAFDLRQQEGEDRSVSQLKHYFRSLFLASSMGKNITIDR